MAHGWQKQKQKDAVTVAVHFLQSEPPRRPSGGAVSLEKVTGHERSSVAIAAPMFRAFKVDDFYITSSTHRNQAELAMTMIMSALLSTAYKFEMALLSKISNRWVG